MIAYEKGKVNPRRQSLTKYYMGRFWKHINYRLCGAGALPPPLGEVAAAG